jgi:hypothetical protein
VDSLFGEVYRAFRKNARDLAKWVESLTFAVGNLSCGAFSKLSHFKGYVCSKKKLRLSVLTVAPPILATEDG